MKYYGGKFEIFRFPSDAGTHVSWYSNHLWLDRRTLVWVDLDFYIPDGSFKAHIVKGQAQGRLDNLPFTFKMADSDFVIEERASVRDADDPGKTAALEYALSFEDIRKALKDVDISK